MNRSLLQSHLPQSRLPHIQFECWIRWATATLLMGTLGLVEFPRSQAIAQAVPPPSTTIQFTPPKDLPDPPDTGDPSGRVAGGRRGCYESGTSTNIPLFSALLPQAQSKNGTLASGLTTTEHPTFWLHTHRGLKNGALVVISLKGDPKGPAQKINLQVPKTNPGIIRFTLPPQFPALVVGQTYQWKLAIYCHSATASGDTESTVDIPEIISGGIQRLAISPNLQRQLAASKTPLERARLYAKNGIWYDSLTTLGLQLQGKTTVDPAITRAWAELLRQGNLETSTTLPIQPCCTPK